MRGYEIILKLDWITKSILSMLIVLIILLNDYRINLLLLFLIIIGIEISFGRINELNKRIDLLEENDKPNRRK